MSENIYNIINSGVIEVKHNGQVVNLNLPEWLKSADGKIYNEEELMLWANDQGIMLALLQKGLQATIIDLRAKARPGDKMVDGKKVKQDLVLEDAQKRVDGYKVTELKAPKMSEKDKMRMRMEKAGIPEEQIQLVLNRMDDE